MSSPLCRNRGAWTPGLVTRHVAVGRWRRGRAVDWKPPSLPRIVCVRPVETHCQPLRSCSRACDEVALSPSWRLGAGRPHSLPSAAGLVPRTAALDGCPIGPASRLPWPPSSLSPCWSSLPWRAPRRRLGCSLWWTLSSTDGSSVRGGGDGGARRRATQLMWRTDSCCSTIMSWCLWGLFILVMKFNVAIYSRCCSCFFFIINLVSFCSDFEKINLPPAHPGGLTR